MEINIKDKLKITLDWFKSHEGSVILRKRVFIFPVVNSMLCIISGGIIAWEHGKPYEQHLLI